MSALRPGSRLPSITPMEASEQLPIHDDPTVRLLDGRLVVEHLEIDDERAARVVRERAEMGQGPAETVAKAIEIGARVIDSEGTAANVDYVRAELEKGVGPLRRELSEKLEEGSEELAEQIAASFGAERSGSVQQQIKEMIRGANEEQRIAIGRLFSSGDGANPLTDFKAAMVRGLKEADERRRHDREADREKIDRLINEVTVLRERLGAKEDLEAEQARGSAKGRTFEELVHAAIERIAQTRGDAATHTGDVQAEGGGKKGDAIVELGAAGGPSKGRILFEAKDKKLTKNAAWAELNEGMDARAASFGVLVVAGEDRVPSGREQLTEYGGNKMIVAVDREDPSGLVLEVAYRLAAARVLIARDGELEVDAVAVRDAAQDAVSTLRQAQAIRSTLTGIKTSSDRARDGLDALVGSVQVKLELIESLAAAGSGDEIDEDTDDE
jgi:hypothetical protein